MLFALLTACDKVPLLAPTGTVITLIPAATAVPNNSQVQIIATVIEHGTSAGGSGTTTTTPGGGNPVQNGTVVDFTTTIGRIEPAEARTHDGQVTVTLFTDSTSGNPTITAYSGGASATNSTIKIGTATVKSVTLSAQPATLGSSGGNSTITATVVNDQGTPVPNIPVTFTTDNGTLNPAAATTDATGTTSTILSTAKTAKVSATTGTVATASALTVTVNPFGLSKFTATPSATTAGTAVIFDVAPAAGANITNVRVNFGDGSAQDLGVLAVEQTLPHAYCSTGTYTATAVVTDAAGGSGSLSTSVLIGALPVTLTAPASPTVGTPVTLTVSFGAAVPQLDHINWAFDDGSPDQTSTGLTITHNFASKGQKTIRADVFGLGGCLIGTAPLVINVQ